MSLIKGTAWTLLGFGATRVVGFAAGLLLVHLLDPEQKGPFDLMVQVCFFGQVFGSLGLHNAAIYLMGREETGTWRTTKALLGTQTGVGLLMAGVLSLVIWQFGGDAPDPTGPLAGIPYVLLLAMIWCIPPRLYGIGANAIHLAQNRVKSYNAVLFTPEVLFLALLGTALLLGVEALEAAVLCKFLAIWLGAITAAVLLRQSAPLSMSLDRGWLAQAMPHGLSYYLTWILRIASQRMDIFLVAALTRDAAAVGLYSFALGMAELLVMLPDQVAPVFFARFSRESDEGKRELTPMVSRHMALVSVVAACGLVLALPPLIVFLNDSYLASLETFRWLLLGTVPMGVARVLFADLQGRGRPDLPMKLDGMALVVVVGLDLLLIPRMGIVGAGVAHAAASALVAVSTLVIYRRISGVGLVKTLVLQRGDFGVWKWICRRMAGRE